MLLGPYKHQIAHGTTRGSLHHMDCDGTRVSACFSAVILADLKARAVQAYGGSRSSNAIPALTTTH